MWTEHTHDIGLPSPPTSVTAVRLYSSVSLEPRVSVSVLALAFKGVCCATDLMTSPGLFFIHTQGIDVTARGRPNSSSASPRVSGGSYRVAWAWAQGSQLDRLLFKFQLCLCI